MLYQITNRTIIDKNTGQNSSVILDVKTFGDGCKSLGWNVSDCWYTTDILPNNEVREVFFIHITNPYSYKVKIVCEQLKQAGFQANWDSRVSLVTLDSDAPQDLVDCIVNKVFEKHC